LNGLDPVATYIYRAKSEDLTGKSASLDGQPFTTLPEPPPQPEPDPESEVPAIQVDEQSVQATQVSSSSAVITWTTNVPGTSQVYYGTSLSYDQNTPVNSAPVIQHQVTITGLNPATLYYFFSESTDAAGNVDSASGLSFQTANAPIIQPDPVQGSLQLTNLKVTAITQTSAVVTWRTDEYARSRVQYGTIPYTHETPLTTRTEKNQSVRIEGLQPGTAYYFRAISVDGKGNQGELSGLHFWTAPPVNGLRVQSVVTIRTDATWADLKWATFPGATCDIEYGIGYPYDQRQVVTAQPLTEHRVMLTNLVPQTMYYYRPLCVDATGNRQEPGGFTFTTK
jgi:hypothetical protein